MAGMRTAGGESRADPAARARPSVPATRNWRTLLAGLTGLAGLAAYNWWVGVLFVRGMVPSPDGFFSDLSANGQPHALLLQRLDLAAGLLLLAALALAGRPASRTENRLWPWLVAFAAVTAVGGLFPYACAAGLDPACRHLERTWQLPVHHDVHMVAGVAEFFTATMAVALARITDPDCASLAGKAGHVLVPVLLIAYPLLGVAYLGGRSGVFIEPVFFVMFSAMVAIELAAPGRSRSRSRAQATVDAEARKPTEPAPG